jgi:excisionase family DNA binding protein
MPTDFLTPREVAELLGVSPITVRHWANQGWIPAQRTAGRHRRFHRADVDRFARERGLSDPGETTGLQRLLVVEDDRQLAAYLEEVLRDFAGRVDVRLAFDGFEAGRQVVSWLPDIVLLDLMLPGVDGFEVCRSLRSTPETAAARVVAMTGFHTDENVRRALQAGSECCLAKPFRRAALLDALGLGDEVPPQGEAVACD